MQCSRQDEQACETAMSSHISGSRELGHEQVTTCYLTPLNQMTRLAQCLSIHTLDIVSQGCNKSRYSIRCYWYVVSNLVTMPSIRFKGY